MLKLAEADPALARPILPGMPDLMAEVAFAVEHEQARTIADVLLRRTRIGLTSASSLDSAESVAGVAAADGSETRLVAGRDAPSARRLGRDGPRRGTEPRAVRRSLSGPLH